MDNSRPMAALSAPDLALDLPPLPADVAAPPVHADLDASWQYSLNLANIRGALIRQEDSIIFSLIERAQFRINAPAYTPDAENGGIQVPGFEGSLMDYVMRETEALHGKVRRYTSPTERPYFPDAIPPIILTPLEYPEVLHRAASDINLNPVVWKMYFNELLPAISAPGDDFNYGSAVTADVLCLQAISKRIHYGVFVAEAKFQEAPDIFGPLIKAKDSEGIMQQLTKPEVEAAVLRRVEGKAAAFGQDIGTPPGGNSSGSIAVGVFPTESDGNRQKFKVQPKVVAALYGRWIIPLTKKVEVDYLLRRLD